MILTFLRRLLCMALLLLLQGLVLNRVSVLGYATPMPYLSFILMFRRGTGRKTLLLWGFFTGLLADLFTDSPGVAAASLTWVALLQPRLLGLFIPRDSADDLQPAPRTMGLWAFLRYLFTATFFFQAAYYLLAAFSFAHVEDLGWNILGGTLTTAILIWAVSGLYRQK